MPDVDSQTRIATIGVRVTWAMAAASLVYIAATTGAPHRGWLLAVTLAAAGDALVVTYVFRHRRLEPAAFDRFQIGWNAAHVAAAVVLCLLDGGLTSPYVVIFYISVAFAAVALPRRHVMVVAALDVLALALVGLLSPETTSGSWGAVIVRGGGLVVMAAVCATIAGDRKTRITALQDSREEMLRRLARVVEYRDSDTGGHVERMSAYCAAIAARLGWSAAECHRLHLAATMHDVGKVAVPDAILLKPGPLTAEERAVMQRHAAVGRDMLSESGSDLLDLAATIAVTHHERYDGAGYPAGLAGEDIPLPGRIVAVADVFDALTSDRVYKRAMDVDAAAGVIRAAGGTQFDPAVVAAFEAALAEIRRLREIHTGPPQDDLGRWTPVVPAPV